uniref:Uncharacterized protein n=1 Tax=uncultured bacterium Contigcl_1769 TaxID=1393659 RepID=W0FMG6_9BACT|nr:hypothetical protein [uncultured bacterium Contigcl_1769]
MAGAPEQAQPSPYSMPAQQQPVAPQQGMGVPGGPVPPQPYGAQPPAGGPQPQPKSSSKTPLIIGIAAVVVVAAIIIAGFATNWFGMGGGGASGGASSGAAPAGDDKAVYVLKSRTNYEADGDLAYIYETERNDRGDIEKTVSESYNNGKLQATFTVTYERDDNGYVDKRKETNDFEDTSTPSKNTYSFDNEFDKDGLLKTATASDEETTYKYFDNGREKSYVTERSSGSTSCEYDENGYEQTYAYEYKSGSFSTKITHELEWEFDKNGYPTGYTISGKQTSNGKTSSDEKECTVEVDDHGNITAIYDEKGTLRSELEWTRIDDPSPAIVSQNVKPMYMVLEF